MRNKESGAKCCTETAQQQTKVYSYLETEKDAAPQVQKMREMTEVSHVTQKPHLHSSQSEPGMNSAMETPRRLR